MIARMRAALGVVGGLNGVLAVVAIAWGLNTLAKVAEDKAAHLEMLDAEIAARVDQLQAEADAAAEAEAAVVEVKPPAVLTVDTRYLTDDGRGTE